MTSSPFFKNLTIYRLADQWTRSAAEIEDALAKFPLQPCAGQSFCSRGWLPVNDSGQLAYGQDKQVMILMGSEEKILPGSVVTRETDQRADKIEQEKGFKLGRKARREIREQVVAELLPRAFSRHRTLRGLFDFADGWLVVDTASATKADEFTQSLRDALGELPVTPLQSEPSMSALMTGWLAAREVPGAFDLDDECELTSADENKSSVRYLRHALDGKDIEGHLSTGKQAQRVAVTWKDRISLVLDHTLMVRKLRFLDISTATDQALPPEQQFEQDFALFSAEVRAMLGDLRSVVGAASA